jgi:ADP-heptose:LPS heptosyltransferase
LKTLILKPSSLGDVVFTHAVDWYLEVLRQLNVPVHWNFDWMPVRPKIASTIRKKWPLHRARWILLYPGAGWPTKRWPIESYQELVDRLVAAYPGSGHRGARNTG